ncbi:MAG: SpoIID/LytB domain-containing protein [Candidatus Muirbacterium halophilum]|nr:SpoIID/LytB domain-containing protein [Candidatus Muirbacterium halophilum]MCK9475051.1 SpoIID/LytB domain-containing protein [Candidatus Muirbacterium halophilum]
MIYKKLLFILIVFILSFSVYSKTPIIRVGILENQNRLVFKCDKGIELRIDNVKVKVFSNEVVVRNSGKNLNIGGRNYSNNYVELYPAFGDFIELDDFKYRGIIRLINNNSGFNVVNVLDIEKYLYGVLANEMLKSSPDEALKTLAVVCRTYALKNLQKHGQNGFDVCSTTHCQVYRGFNTESDNIIKAVDSTRGIVITYLDELISAYHHSACGGGTTDNETAWTTGSEIPYTRGRWCDFCEESPRANWEFELSMSELSQRFRNLNIGNIIRINVEQSDSFGRAKSIMLTGEKGECLVSANQFRLEIGAQRIWSTMFEIYGFGGNSAKLSKKIDKINTILKSEKKDFIKKILLESEEKRNNIRYDGYKIKGHGSGHGVGLCQWGAIGLSKKGLNYKEIIKFYYTNVETMRLY